MIGRNLQSLEDFLIPSAHRSPNHSRRHRGKNAKRSERRQKSVSPSPRQEEVLEESLEPLVKFQKGAPPPPPPPPPQSTLPVRPLPLKSRSRVCRYAKWGDPCPNGDNCDGAHSPEEFFPRTCGFGDSCRFIQWSGVSFTNTKEKVCVFIHPSENEEWYYTRTGRRPPSFRHPKRSSEDGQSFQVVQRKGPRHALPAPRPRN